MLASHNTMTYLPPARGLHRLTAWIWHCQSRRPADTPAALLDLRVRLHGGLWWWAHGSVRLGRAGAPLIADLLAGYCVPCQPCRLVLESGDARTESLFAAEARKLRLDGWPVITAAIKEGWRVIYRDAAEEARCRDHYYKPCDSALPWWRNALNLLRHLSTPARYAWRHPIQTPEITDDLYHFHDFL